LLCDTTFVSKVLTGEDFAGAVRGHGAIENNWSLAIKTFRFEKTNVEFPQRAWG